MLERPTGGLWGLREVEGGKGRAEGRRGEYTDNSQGLAREWGHFWGLEGFAGLAELRSWSGRDKGEMDFVGRARSRADTLLGFFRTPYQTPNSTYSELIHKEVHK